MITELLKNSGRNSDEKNHFYKRIFSCPNIDQHQRKCLTFIDTVALNSYRQKADFSTYMAVSKLGQHP